LLGWEFSDASGVLDKYDGAVVFGSRRSNGRIHSSREHNAVFRECVTDGIDSVIGSEMADTVFVDPADLLI
jgi:hypothetical protein